MAGRVGRLEGYGRRRSSVCPTYRSRCEDVVLRLLAAVEGGAGSVMLLCVCVCLSVCLVRVRVQVTSAQEGKGETRVGCQE